MRSAGDKGWAGCAESCGAVRSVALTLSDMGAWGSGVRDGK